MTRHLLMGLVGCLLAFAQSASAADPQKASEAKFETLDKNRDGKVSINEATEHDALFVAFENLDKDRDGVLTKQEFDSYRNAR